MRRVCGVILIVTGLAAAASAQPTAGSFTSTVSGAVGGGTTWDDEGRIGSGALIGIRGDRRLFGNTFAEAALDYLHHTRTGNFEASGNTLFVSASLMQRFGRRAAQPYVFGGIAIAHHGGRFGFPADGSFTDVSSTDTGFAFGGGVAIRIAGGFEVGPEARFLILRADTDSAPAYANWIGARVGARF
jgi:opacity protein-like surface antigen